MNAAALSPRRTSFHAVIDAWRGIGPIHVVAALLLGAGAFMLASLPHWKENLAHGAYAIMARGLLVNEVIAFCVMLAVIVADRSPAEGARRRAAYITAVIVGVTTGAAIEWLIQHFAWNAFARPANPNEQGIPIVTFELWRATGWFMYGGFAVFLHAHRRQTVATTARLRTAELNRLGKSRQMLEARLKVMQARVEPQFLFNTLAQVRKLYRTDAALAENMLDQLIAYLRAAMPRMRDTSSTLAQEAELTRSYLEIVKLRMGGRLTYAIDVPPELGDTRLPPMMLLPLIDHAVVHGLETPHAEGTLEIRCTSRQDRLRLAITDSGAGFVPEEGGSDIDGIRERLGALYGNRASLVLARTGDRHTQALMELPLERAVDR